MQFIWIFPWFFSLEELNLNCWKRSTHEWTIHLLMIHPSSDSHHPASSSSESFSIIPFSKNSIDLSGPSGISRIESLQKWMMNRTTLSPRLKAQDFKGSKRIIALNDWMSKDVPNPDNNNKRRTENYITQWRNQINSERWISNDACTFMGYT